VVAHHERTLTGFVNLGRSGGFIKDAHSSVPTRQITLKTGWLMAFYFANCR
jgi:hypothetical protein